MYFNYTPSFDKTRVLHELQHLLPAQEPLVNFVHHNTLHCLQNMEFDTALSHAAQIFGYKVYLSVGKYRELFLQGLISEAILHRTIIKQKGTENQSIWLEKLSMQDYAPENQSRIGALRNQWKKYYAIDLDWHIYPLLFRLICNYLDQGIALWAFPIEGKSFLESIRELEQKSSVSLFKTARARSILVANRQSMEDLLELLLGNDSTIYEQYLYDQQFGHKGWSGMVTTIEHNPKTLLDPKQISLADLIYFELLLEIDTLDYLLGENWSPLNEIMERNLPMIHEPLLKSELLEVLALWQKAFEWSYYDQVLSAIQQERLLEPKTEVKSFQGLFCIDDRECSFRRYLEILDSNCETFGLPGFFNVPLFYQASGSNFYSKLAPAPVSPTHLIQERGKIKQPPKNLYFAKNSHNFIIGWIMAQTLGFWFPLKLLLNLLNPTAKIAYDSSIHNARIANELSIDYEGVSAESGLQIGYTIEEMSECVWQLLTNIGLTTNFANLVYVVGHGASSANNTHYAAYDCGACSGRDGRVNAQVFAHMANNLTVRENLRLRGITIPQPTRFIASLHDTTRDQVIFYDLDKLDSRQDKLHQDYQRIFHSALEMNAKERSRRFALIDSGLSAQKIHRQVINRSFSIFEPRPELNHATNALCVIGSRELSKGLFLDRRSFLQSYNYKTDENGATLANILKAAVPVCGGINLEYYFSKVDQNNLGAGSKLPHNVMGLFGVANGTDGDLRTGLPSQMIEVHDSIRLLFIIEHYPEVVLKGISADATIHQWFVNAWVNLAVIHPDSKQIFIFNQTCFEPYTTLAPQISANNKIGELLANNEDNLPVYLI